MAQQPQEALTPAFTAALGAIAEAVEGGAGLPEVARACGRALDASIAVVDASSRVLAVACASPEDERAVLSGEGGSEQIDLTVGGAVVGRLHFRERGEPNPPDLIRVVAAILALELDRARGPSARARRRCATCWTTSSRASSPTARTSSRARPSWVRT